MVNPLQQDPKHLALGFMGSVPTLISLRMFYFPSGRVPDLPSMLPLIFPCLTALHRRSLNPVGRLRLPPGSRLG